MNLIQDTKTDFFGKLKKASWGIAIFFMLIAMLQTCSLSRKVTVLTKTVKEIQSQSATKDDIIKQFQIEGLRTSKRILYDNNAIIRTSIRPDDRMNEYDAEIKKLQGN